MTVDRFGSPVRISWSAHEILWVEAALTLNVHDRMAAYRDISSMTGRTLYAVQRMGEQLRAAHRKAQDERRQPVRMRLPSAPMPSLIKPPTLAQLMGRR